MKLDFNTFALFETVGFIQAITLGTLLIILNKKKYKSTLFLGLFLIFFALETIPIILESVNAFEVYPQFYLLPFDFFWLHFPMFYLYTQHVCIFSEHKKKYWVLYPGIIAFFAQLFVFFLPYETKLEITGTLSYGVYFNCKIIYGLSIGIYTLRLLYHHKIEVNNYFSMVDYKELTWARIFLIYNISGSILYTIIYNSIGESTFAKVFFVVFDLILIYWVSYHGVEQRNVLSLLAKRVRIDIPSNESPLATNITNVSIDNLEILMKRIDDYMTSTKGYMHTEFTIVDLSTELDVHPKRISTAINTICHQNFNSYVNQFRIRKAEKLLENEDYKNFSIEGIGYEVGFHSKSAFYSAFKKFTGTTPSKYKQNVMA